MKPFLSFLSILLLLSCSTDPKALLIEEYVETIDNEVRTDLNFKLLNMEFVKDVTIVDSMEAIHSKYLADKFDPGINWIDSLHTIYTDLVSDTKSRIARYDSIQENDLDLYLDASMLNPHYELQQGLSDEIKNQKKWTKAKIEYDKYFGRSLDELLGKTYSVKYKINNPFLNGAEQTINKSFIFSPDESQILDSF